MGAFVDFLLIFLLIHILETLMRTHSPRGMNIPEGLVSDLSEQNNMPVRLLCEYSEKRLDDRGGIGMSEVGLGWVRWDWDE